MPKLIPMPVLLDLLDGGPVVKLVIERRKAKKGTTACHQCIGKDRTDCRALREAAELRGAGSCMDHERHYYALRPLRKDEVR